MGTLQLRERYRHEPARAVLDVAGPRVVIEGRTAAAGAIDAEAGRRRTFAVISHPDAGKSTLTESIALAAAAITEAGNVHARQGRRGVTSDWMAMERERGISVTSAVLSFAYRDHVFNLLDTPGHADFSEDTYRVLTAVDCAIMLLDAAKGLEPQTLKLFDVCRHRKVPVLAFVNKWDRPGRAPLELLDEIEQRIGLRPAPLTWPVGIAGDLRGVVDRRRDAFVRFGRPAPGSLPTETVTSLDAAAEEGDAWEAAAEELALVDAVGGELDHDAFLAGTAAPVLFGAALRGYGVRQLLDALTDLAPAPAPRLDAEGSPRALDAPFSGHVFKVQANMDRAHRDRIAFVRVCSGKFERGMVVTHAATGRPFATKYAHHMFGQERTTADVAYPGDVVGLVNASALRPGDTLYAGPRVGFPPIPTYAPEHFAVAHAPDVQRQKQFRRGIAQLDAEGAVQVLHAEDRGEQAPVLAAVGPMQFDVVRHRLQHEFGCEIDLSPLPYTLVRRTDRAGAERLRTQPGVAVLVRVQDGAHLALFPDRWRLQSVERDVADVMLAPLVAGSIEAE